MSGNKASKSASRQRRVTKQGIKPGNKASKSASRQGRVTEQGIKPDKDQVSGQLSAFFILKRTPSCFFNLFLVQLDFP